MKTRPGSPEAHALSQIMFQSSRARMVFFTSPFQTRSHGASALTASMKGSLTQTDRLAWLMRVRFFLTVMNSSMSGWLSLSISISAPRRLPPCWITSPVATE
jgi:hypothetical protein